MVRGVPARDRVRPTDGPMVRYAAIELGLVIVGRRWWRNRGMVPPPRKRPARTRPAAGGLNVGTAHP